MRSRSARRLLFAIVALAIVALVVLVLVRRSRGATENAPPAPAAKIAAPLHELLAYVPDDAVAVIACDLDKTRGSRALMQGLAVLIEKTGLAGKVGALDGIDAIAIAALPEPMVVVRSAANAAAVVAAPAIEQRALAAFRGGNVIDGGALRDAVSAVRKGPSAFAAVRMTDGLRRELAQLLPGLDTIQWVGATLDTSSGIALAGIATFSDAATAASVAMTVNVGKSLAKSQLPANLAGAIGKMSFTAIGDAIKVSAWWTEADVDGLVVEAR